MKKSLLIIVSDTSKGGVAASFRNFVKFIAETKKYHVDILVLNKNIDKQFLLNLNDVNLIVDKNQCFFSPIKCILKSFCSKDINLLDIIRWLFFRLYNRSKAAYFLSRLIDRLDYEYDIALDYGGQQMLYYMVDYINAKKKISYFHSDYNQWPFYYDVDKYYYPYVDAILTISPTCVNSLKKYFPECRTKIFLLENIIDRNQCVKKSLEFSSCLPECFNIITVGHLSESKGTDLAIDTALLLKNNNVLFHWTFIGGDNISIKRFKSKSDKFGLSEVITFRGNMCNPYPFYKDCNIVVHPSKFEGKSIALDEAKCFSKPCVVTNFSTVLDQFVPNVNGIIVNMSAEDIFKGIMMLKQDRRLYQKIENNLTSQFLKPKSIIKKFETYAESK